MVESHEPSGKYWVTPGLSSVSPANGSRSLTTKVGVQAPAQTWRSRQAPLKFQSSATDSTAQWASMWKKFEMGGQSNFCTLSLFFCAKFL